MLTDLMTQMQVELIFDQGTVVQGDINKDNETRTEIAKKAQDSPRQKVIAINNPR